MKDKLLIVNRQDTAKTHYHSPKDIGSWLWGRQLSNYLLFVIKPDGDAKQIILETAEITKIQKIIDNIFKGN